MTKQQEMPRHCLGQMNRLSSREQHTISHTYYIGHGVNTVIQVDYFLLILDLMLDNEQFSLDVPTGPSTAVVVPNKADTHIVLRN